MKSSVLQLPPPCVNKSLILKGFLLTSLLLSSTSVYAFGGGGGGGRVSTARKHGMNALGMHIGVPGQADIKFKCDDPNSHPDDHGICVCNEGYEPDESGVCVIPGPQPIICNPCEDLVEEECVARTCGTNMHCDSTQDQCVCDEGLQFNTDNTCTVCTNGNVYLSYMDDPCGMVIDGFAGCKSNKDCSTGQYCALKNEGDFDFPPHFPLSGTCTDIGTYTDATIEGLGQVRASNNSLTWWSAENWCKAQGKNLIDMGKFECYYSETNDQILPGGNADYCCAKNESCSFEDWFNCWNGSSLKDECQETIKVFSPIVVNMQKTFSSFSFWTASDYTNTYAPFAGAFIITTGLSMGFDMSVSAFDSALCQ